jgi:hypothetical protein
MKNIQNEEENAFESAQGNQVKKLVMFAAVGLKLGRKIFEKLEKVEESIEILARQKARELNPDKPPETAE